nr:MAG TPA: hypothetical protein [Caudoviricetes sp.]
MVLLQVLFDGLPLRVRAPCHAHGYTSVMSIPKRSFSNFFFMAYSLVRVARLFTSSTTCTPWAPSWYVKSALYRMARTRRPSVSVYASWRVKSTCRRRSRISPRRSRSIRKSYRRASFWLSNRRTAPEGVTRVVGVFRYLFTFSGSCTAAEGISPRRACCSMYFFTAWAWYFGGRSEMLMAILRTPAGFLALFRSSAFCSPVPLVFQRLDGQDVERLQAPPLLRRHFIPLFCHKGLPQLDRLFYGLSPHALAPPLPVCLDGPGHQRDPQGGGRRFSSRQPKKRGRHQIPVPHHARGKKDHHNDGRAQTHRPQIFFHALSLRFWYFYVLPRHGRPGHPKLRQRAGRVVCLRLSHDPAIQGLSVGVSLQILNGHTGAGGHVRHGPKIAFRPPVAVELPQHSARSAHIDQDQQRPRFRLSRSALWGSLSDLHGLFSGQDLLPPLGFYAHKHRPHGQRPFPLPFSFPRTGINRHLSTANSAT